MTDIFSLVISAIGSHLDHSPPTCASAWNCMIGTPFCPAVSSDYVSWKILLRLFLNPILLICVSNSNEYRLETLLLAFFSLLLAALLGEEFFFFRPPFLAPSMRVCSFFTILSSMFLDFPWSLSVYCLPLHSCAFPFHLQPCTILFPTLEMQAKYLMFLNCQLPSSCNIFIFTMHQWPLIIYKEKPLQTKIPLSFTYFPFL
jgi:hypothetical protein